MFCPSCGNKVEETDLYCKTCGKELSEKQTHSTSSDKEEEEQHAVPLEKTEEVNSLEEQLKSSTAIIIIVIVLFNIFKMMWHNYTITTYDLGAAFGSTIFGLFIVFGIAPNGAKVKVEKLIKSRAIILVAYLVISGGMFAYKISDESNLDIDLPTLSTEVVEYIQDDEQLYKVTEKTYSYMMALISYETIPDEVISVDVYGDYTDVVKFSHKYCQAIQSLIIQYQEDLNTIGVDDIYSDEVLTNQVKLGEVRRCIEKVLILDENYQKNIKETMAAFDKEAALLKTRTTDVDEFVTGYIEGMKGFDEVMGATFKISNELIVSYDEVLCFLQEIPMQYEVQNGILMFRDQEDLDQYEELNAVFTSAITNYDTTMSELENGLDSVINDIEKVLVTE